MSNGGSGLMSFISELRLLHTIISISDMRAGFVWVLPALFPVGVLG